MSSSERRDQARDVHLGDADALGDLALGEALEEAQAHDRLLAGRQRAHAAGQQDAALGRQVLLVLLAQQLERGAVLADRLLEGDGGVALGALHRVQDLLLGRLAGLRELGDVGGAAELDRQAVDGLRELGVELLDVARHADGPPAVAEVALDLAGDVRGGEGGELDAAVDVEAVDGLDEADGPDLDEVVERLAAVGVATGDVADQRHHPLDQLTTRLEVPITVVALEERELVGDGGHGGLDDVLGAHRGWASGGRGGRKCCGHLLRGGQGDKAVKGGQGPVGRPVGFDSGWSRVVITQRDVPGRGDRRVCERRPQGKHGVCTDPAHKPSTGGSTRSRATPAGSDERRARS